MQVTIVVNGDGTYTDARGLVTYRWDASAHAYVCQRCGAHGEPNLHSEWHLEQGDVTVEVR